MEAQVFRLLQYQLVVLVVLVDLVVVVAAAGAELPDKLPLWVGAAGQA